MCRHPPLDLQEPDPLARRQGVECAAGKKSIGGVPGQHHISRQPLVIHNHISLLTLRLVVDNVTLVQDEEEPLEKLRLYCWEARPARPRADRRYDYVLSDAYATCTTSRARRTRACSLPPLTPSTDDTNNTDDTDSSFSIRDDAPRREVLPSKDRCMATTATHIRKGKVHGHEPDVDLAQHVHSLLKKSMHQKFSLNTALLCF